MVAVIGESGVGKSTLLHILGGLDRPTAGEIEIDNDPFLNKNESELATYRNAHIGFVFQHHYLLEDFTALENVMIPALISGSRLVMTDRYSTREAMAFIQNHHISVLPLAYKDALSIAILLLILFFRPSGLFGSTEAGALKEF